MRCKRIIVFFAILVLSASLIIPAYAADYSQDGISNSSVIVLPYLDFYGVYHEFIFHNDGYETPPFIGQTIYSIDNIIKYTWSVPTTVPINVGGDIGTVHVRFGTVKIEAYGTESTISYVTPNNVVIGTTGFPSTQNVHFHVTVSNQKPVLGLSTYSYNGMSLASFDPIPWVGIRLQSQTGMREEFYDKGYQAGYEYMRDQYQDEIDQSYQEGVTAGYDQAIAESEISDMLGAGLNGFFTGIGNVIQPFLSLGIGSLTVGTFVGLGLLILGVILMIKLVKG